jgi:alpha-tubulin suppressor-like RCC1 family protein
LKVPNAPTIGTVTAGNAQVSVAFTAPSNVGGGVITSYIAIAQSAAGVLFSATDSASPITITGLTNGTAYTVQVCAVNAYGPGPYSTGTSGTPVQPRLLYTWGQNSYGQLGQNDRVDRSSPTQVGADTTWSSISSGTQQSAATGTDGKLWAWGRNNFGQLGQNDLVNRSSPVQIGALTNWSSVICSGEFMLAVKTNGTLWAWGNGSYGQLGLNQAGSYANRSSPVQVGGLTNWTSNISVSYNHTVATKTDGTLWSWGSNNDGQLGQNDRVNRSSPVQVGALTNWSKISPKMNIAIKTDGTIWSWSQNQNGQLGQNDRVYRSSPVQIGALTNWSNVSGSNSIAAIKTDGTLWTWGENSYGTLGQNDRVDRSSPVQVGALTNWAKSAASGPMLAIKTDGTLWSWGYNIYGQTGQNDKVSRSSPVQVGSATTWILVDTNNIFSIAISS